MNKEELQKIIDLLESNNSSEDAYFGIFDDNPDAGECHIRANKQGLELFASEILKASRDAEEIVNDKEKTLIPLNENFDWKEGDILIQYIEPTLEKREKARLNLPKQTLLSRIVIGCFLMLLVLCFTAFVVGMISIFKWIF